MNFPGKHLLVGLFALQLAHTPAVLHAQAAAAPPARLEFEVASVRPNKSGGRPSSNFPLDSGNVYSTLNPSDAHTPAGGFFSASNQPMWRYITFAYKLTGTQELALRFSYFTGLSSKVPSWVTGGFDVPAEAFDIEARAASSPTKDQMRLMMQSLLADRFHLVAHYETRQAPVFALILARDGQTGPNFRPHPAGDSCSTEPPADSPPQNPPAPERLPPVCGVIAHLPPSAPGRYRIGGRNVPLSLLASSLPTQTGMATLSRPVLDATGLPGAYDFTLEWSPEADPAAPPSTASGPTFREALRQQLGLDLKSTQGPINLLILDHIDHPTEN